MLRKYVFGTILASNLQMISMMKTFYIIAVLILPFLSFSAVEANPSYDQVADQIVQSISKGDAAGVAKFFDTSVDVNILGKSGTYSKPQAEQMLKTFFSQHRVDKFEIIHNTSSPNNSSNAFVGWLTSNGKRYRLFVQMAESGNSKIIQEISVRER